MRRRPNGFEETIQKGISGLEHFSGDVAAGAGSRGEALERLAKAWEEADAVVAGAGAGLSASAGHVYSGARFRKYFGDFAEKYGVTDMYSGGFFPFPRPEVRWAWWARMIYFNRCLAAPGSAFRTLKRLLAEKDHFVITTNVDHQFQLAGFDKSRLFYTQGDYGTFRSADPMNRHTYDNLDWAFAAMEAMGYVRDEEGIFRVPEGGTVSMELPSDLVPVLPDGSDAVLNLRGDDTFVEDEGWKAASAAYAGYLAAHETGKVLYLELGIGANTPVIIKYPFWEMTYENPEAVYACLNLGEAFCPGKIADRAVLIDGDIGDALSDLERTLAKRGEKE